MLVNNELELAPLSDDVEDLAALLPRARDEPTLGSSDGWDNRDGRRALWHLRTARARNASLSVVGAFAVALLGSNWLGHEPRGPATASVVGEDGVVPYTCPSTVERSTNDKNPEDFDLYLEDDRKHVNKTLADYRSMPLDGWGINYTNIKAMLRPWKEEVFVPNVRSGDSIYESACGIGMNLLLTAEILQESSINGVTIYGNDYVSESVAIANRIWSEQDGFQTAIKGRFCRGDSSDLDFVPSTSFDLVYTGYIDPINDPLDLLPANSTAVDKWDFYVKMCKSSKPEDMELAKRAQLVQEEWFNSWVQELIRIAKPGRVIAIENGAESICTNVGDWGGVDKSWWSRAATKYGWEIDRNSIAIRDEKAVGAWRDIRYHVMMRKK